MSIKRTRCKYCCVYFRDHEFEEDEPRTCYSCKRIKEMIALYAKSTTMENPFQVSQLGKLSREYWGDKLNSLLL